MIRVEQNLSLIALPKKLMGNAQNLIFTCCLLREDVDWSAYQLCADLVCNRAARKGLLSSLPPSSFLGGRTEQKQVFDMSWSKG